MISIQDQIDQRRSALGDARGAGGDDIWGLALSGGGIRSATFCFGLLRALAHNRVLLKFDLLSTVSGGGYIGAMLGRLFSRAASVADVHEINTAITDADSRWFAWWLRANGRYLTPRGARDWTYAVALYIRSLVGIHFEFGLVALLLGVGLGAFDVWVWRGIDHWAYSDPQLAFPALRYLPSWMPAIALVEPVVMFVGAAIAIAYWCVPWAVRSGRWSAVAALVMWMSVCAILLVLLLSHAAGWAAAMSARMQSWPLLSDLTPVSTTVGAPWRLALEVCGFVLAAGWCAGLPIAYVTRIKTRGIEPEVLKADAMRTSLTKGLAECFRVAAVIAILGLIDRAAWFIAYDLDSVAHVGVGLGVTAAVMRAVAPKLTGLTPGRMTTGVLLRMGRVVGYLLTFVLSAWWVSLVYTAGLGALFQHGGPNFGDALTVLAVLAVPLSMYLLLTGSNLEFLNLSSLHGFYRARLVRSYLGASNSVRLGRKPPFGAIDTVPTPMRPASESKQVAVGDTELDDDLQFCRFDRTTFRGYAPFAHGGPAHLINMCINQTKDPRGGLFNQDRRGLALCVASGGIMKVGQEAWKPLPRDDMTLGTWTAISGAAVAPGLGSLTRGGVSALAFFAGVRLGYWWEKSIPRFKRMRVYAKSLGMLAEAFGVFRGTQNSNWFLTDGGHFENTGAYALLAERARLIVVADCGADPHYAFCDLENLVRKARIDLQAEIIFQKPICEDRAEKGSSWVNWLLGKKGGTAARAKLAGPMALFGSLNDLASDTSTACLAFAKIIYRGRRSGKGFLILVKPNISSGLPVDLINFKAQNAAFPQETTADQWFTEAQWESYSQLGYYLGAKLDPAFFNAIERNSATFFEADERAPFTDSRGSARERETAATTETGVAGASGAGGATGVAATVRRLPARIGAGSVRAGLGIGAVATLAVSAWQGIDTSHTSHVRRTSDQASALREVTDLWARVPPQSTSEAKDPMARASAVGEVAAAILRATETLCPAGEQTWFEKSALAATVYDSALKECGDIDAKSRPHACATLLEAADPRLQGAFPPCLVRYEAVSPAIPPPHYGIHDYSRTAPIALAHPCDGIAAQRRDARRRQSENPLDPTERADGGDGELAVGCAAPAVAEVTTPAPCAGKTIYLLIYSSTQIPVAEEYGALWRAAGSLVTQSENVTESARLAGRAGPLPVPTTTVRYGDGESKSCAQSLSAPHGWHYEPVSQQTTSPPGVIEVWLAPGTSP